MLRDEKIADPVQQGLSPEALERLVYFVGPTRSGTGIIARSFFKIDSVFALPKYVQFTKNVWRHRYTVNANLLHRLFEVPKFYREPEVLKSLPKRTRQRLQRRIREAFALRHFGRMYQLYPLIYALDPTCEKDPTRARCWSDKANDTYGLFVMPRYLPQAKFVFIARDPRAVVASAQRQSLIASEAIDDPSARFSALVASSLYWRNMMQTLLRFANRYPNRTKFIRYEDFVLAPEATLNSLLEFVVDESVSAEKLTNLLQGLKFPRKHESSGGGMGIDRRPLERWRRMMNPEEVALVRAFTWRTGRKFGYEIEAEPLASTVLALTRLKGWRTRTVAALKLAYLQMMEKRTPATRHRPPENNL